MSSPKRIILVEDDAIQAQFIAEEVIWELDPGADVRYFDSEYSLLEALKDQEFIDWNPQYAIIDLLIRYYSPQDMADLKDRKQVIDLENVPDPYLAGIRSNKTISDQFTSTEKSNSIKVAILTVLDTSVIDKSSTGSAVIIQKGSDELTQQLFAFLRS